MAKNKLRLKIQGFELEIEGENLAAPNMAQHIGQQLNKLLEPATNIMTNQPPRKHVDNTSANGVGDRTEIKSSPSKRGKRSGSGSGAKDLPEYQHNKDKHGEPAQAWNPTRKALWLLRCLDLSGQPAELTAAQVAGLFNAHFKAFGKLLAGNVARDLNKVSVGGPNALIVLDGDKYSLSSKGKTDADKLIAEATGATLHAGS